MSQVFSSTVNIKDIKVVDFNEMDEGWNELIEDIVQEETSFDIDIFYLTTWSPEQAVKYMNGVSNSSTWEDEGFGGIHYRMLDGKIIKTYAFEEIELLPFEKNIQRLEKLWIDADHNESNPPKYYIDWALSIKHEIPWLNFAIEQGFYKPEQLQEVESKNSLADKDRAYVSDYLATLNQAAARFWANSDPNDNTDHPINPEVVAWLMERGYKLSLAEKAATIIRPKWATTGRKADK